MLLCDVVLVVVSVVLLWFGVIVVLCLFNCLVCSIGVWVLDDLCLFDVMDVFVEVWLLVDVINYYIYCYVEFVEV